MIRSITNRFNTIIDFLTEIENYNIIILLKPNLNDKLAENNST